MADRPLSPLRSALPVHVDPPNHPDPHAGSLQSKPARTNPRPRSRKGCLKCRDRKVKCDEEKPTCGSCKRLNHDCEWKRSIVIKDETSHIIHRETAVSFNSCLVWNPSASVMPTESNQPKERDTLPPFHELSSEALREKKASYYNPGTFALITLPEYYALPDDLTSSSHPKIFGTNRHSSAQQDHSTFPNYVIPTKFGNYSVNHKQSEHPDSRKDNFASASSPSELPATLVGREKDSYLLEYYRNVLARQIYWLAEQVSGPDIFETCSANYPPLYLAILALSSLSLSKLNQTPFVHALKRYDMVITALLSSLKNEDSAHCDGRLFTHYLLLLFEVAATGNHELNMWEHHSSQIIHILQLRQQVRGKEPYGFIIVYIFYVDLYALLTTTGTGSFSKTVIEQNMLPAPEDALTNRLLNMTFIPKESLQMPDLLRMNRELALIALEMARMGRRFRSEERDFSMARLEVKIDQYKPMKDLQELLMKFRVTWSTFLETKTPKASWLHEFAELPSGLFTCRTHANLFYRACKIYCHTSMYQGQSLIRTAEVEEELSSCAREIVLITKMMMDLGCLRSRYVVFPIFMAGIVSQVKKEKQIALDALFRLEETSIGLNTRITREFLASIIEKQNIAIAETGNQLRVSWFEEMQASGKQLVLMGL
ncbi:hypothetical protein BCIN_01g09850 [Botrytis cinerea B05.10]|uniref:Zn(2)-C6 fungal-type domain-containing protein n=1 Tax=Botryotinia fuckeliana (strain B05.10) TaxID=332648 RepID=A0A384J6S1_BOTFB|nr:hypothetical protein BCIN_01g09850 [Botrytis cinerea B05.10]ATZ46378.1 hypothetical protein BCIN_01g09850 [Botrytis cinerea B05.10]